MLDPMAIKLCRHSIIQRKSRHLREYLLPDILYRIFYRFEPYLNPIVRDGMVSFLILSQIRRSLWQISVIYCLC